MASKDFMIIYAKRINPDNEEEDLLPDIPESESERAKRIEKMNEEALDLLRAIATLKDPATKITDQIENMTLDEMAALGQDDWAKATDLEIKRWMNLRIAVQKAEDTLKNLRSIRPEPAEDKKTEDV